MVYSIYFALITYLRFIIECVVPKTFGTTHARALNKNLNIKNKFIIKLKIMNQEEIMAVLPHSEAEAKSLRDIAQAMGLETSSYASWIKAERCLSRQTSFLLRFSCSTTHYR